MPQIRQINIPNNQEEELRLRDHLTKVLKGTTSQKMKEQIFSLALERGVDINSLDSNGQTLLEVSAQTENLDMIKFLLNKNANINNENDLGQTVLHIAAAKGQIDTMKFLMKNGSDITASDIYGFNPLHAAILSNQPQSVDLLIKSGINIYNFNEDTSRIRFSQVLSQDERQSESLNTFILTAIELSHKMDPSLDRNEIKKIIFSLSESSLSHLNRKTSRAIIATYCDDLNIQSRFEAIIEKKWPDMDDDFRKLRFAKARLVQNLSNEGDYVSELRAQNIANKSILDLYSKEEDNLELSKYLSRSIIHEWNQSRITGKTMHHKYDEDYPISPNEKMIIANTLKIHRIIPMSQEEEYNLLDYYKKRITPQTRDIKVTSGSLANTTDPNLNSYRE